MRHILLCAIYGYVAAFGVLYLAGVYVSFEFDLRQWPDLGRAAHAWFSTFGAIIGGALTSLEQ